MPAMHFGRSRRLIDGAVFKALLNHGFGVQVGPVGARLQATEVAEQRLAPGRLGLNIPKRHLKRAVDRNRVKRAVRESFRLQGSALQGLDVLVSLRREPQALRLAAGRAQLRQAVDALLERVASAAAQHRVEPRA